MTEQKQVWKVNTGQGVPSDFGDEIMLVYNHLVSKTKSNPHLKNSSSWEFYGDKNDIAAYQTNRTKAAKYERVECGVCDGDGFVFIPVAWSVGAPKEKCSCCNGKGYTLEKIK